MQYSQVDSKVVFFKLPSGIIVPCESKYLKTHSQVFERMLSQTYIDSKQTFILISDINEKAFLKLIHFMCGCRVRLDVYSQCEGICLHDLKYGNTFEENKSMEQNKQSEMSVGEQSIESVVIQLNNKMDKTCEGKVGEMLFPTQPMGEVSEEEKFVTAENHSILQVEESTIFGIQLLGCSERFFVDELKLKCENLLMSITCEENVVDLFLLSLLQNSFLLKNYTFNYLLTSINSPMVRTKCFAELLYSNEKNAFLGYLRSEFVKRLHRQDL